MVKHLVWIQIQLENGGYISGIFNIPGMLLDYHVGDLMHAGDLGVLQPLLGNVLFELFQSMGGMITKPIRQTKDQLIISIPVKISAIIN